MPSPTEPLAPKDVDPGLSRLLLWHAVVVFVVVAGNLGFLAYQVRGWWAESALSARVDELEQRVEAEDVAGATALREELAPLILSGWERRRDGGLQVTSIPYDARAAERPRFESACKRLDALEAARRRRGS